MELSPITPIRGEVNDPNRKVITPKIPEAAPDSPFLDFITIVKPAVWETPIIEQKNIKNTRITMNDFGGIIAIVNTNKADTSITT